MIVCLCRSLNCKAVRQAIGAGARTPAQVHAHHGVKINCGKCSSTLCEMLQAHGAGPGRSAALTAAQ